MQAGLSSLLSRLLIDRGRGHRASVISAFDEKQRLSSVDVAQRRTLLDQKLADLLNHARKSVAHYRELMADMAEATPANAREILSSLPVMKRSDIQADPDRFTTPGIDFVEDATGGSSGTPMKFRVDHATQIARESSLYWSDSLAGWKYGERIAMLWGSDKDVKSAGQIMRSNLRWKIDNRRWYNAFNMGEQEMDSFHADLSRFKPHIVVAYSGSLDIYARYLESKGIVPDYPARGLISSAEMLTPAIRENAERVFKKPVFNRYGNREFGALAAEDGKGEGLAINPSDCILEIDSPDPVKVPGPLLVTYLHNKAMPFIRYNTGDLARLTEDGKRLAGLAGRESDTIKTASGKLIHGEFFTHLLYHVKSVREFQFVQEEINRYCLLLVADQREDSKSEQKLRDDILEEVGQDADLRFEYVDSIPVLPSGKRKFTISHLES